MSFEDALTSLKRSFGRSRMGRKLDDAISAYERGVTLKRHCESKLKEAQAKIEQITVGETPSARPRSWVNKYADKYQTGRLLHDAMAETSRLINLAIDDMLPDEEGDDGKLIVHALWLSWGGNGCVRCSFADICLVRVAELSLRVAAIEFIHCYSLIHDDLPRWTIPI